MCERERNKLLERIYLVWVWFTYAKFEINLYKLLYLLMPSLFRTNYNISQTYTHARAYRFIYNVMRFVGVHVMYYEGGCMHCFFSRLSNRVNFTETQSSVLFDKFVTIISAIEYLKAEPRYFFFSGQKVQIWT